MFKNVTDALGQFFTTRNESNDPLVRMFRVEYANDYRHAVKNGMTVNSAFVKDYLKYRK